MQKKVAGKSGPFEWMELTEELKFQISTDVQLDDLVHNFIMCF